MTGRLAGHLRGLDPRLKLGGCLLFGPGVWLLDPVRVLGLAVLLSFLALPLAASHPLGRSMLRRLAWFVLFWGAIKVGLDLLAGVVAADAVLGGFVVAIRLSALLLLGLILALSTSARSLGMAVAWALRPFIGGERAWRAALSLALMVHFLPLSLSTLEQVSSAFRSRLPRGPLRVRALTVPLAVVRVLAQKTWSQTLAVAGRRLDRAGAWEPDFAWALRDTLWLVGVGMVLSFALLV
ncbi:MAG: cobalt transporter [Pseudodesulfovibrio sp.]